MNKLTALLVLILPVLLFSITIEIPEPDMSVARFNHDLPVIIEPGQPMLPIIPLQILLPMGEKLQSVSVIPAGPQNQLEVERIEPANYQVPLSSHNYPKAEPDPEIYLNDSFFPGYDHKVLDVQRMKGYDILLINLYPYQYNPVKNLLKWNGNYKIEFTSEFDPRTYEEQSRYLSPDKGTRSRLSDYVLNPELMNSYRKTYQTGDRSLPDPSNPFTMIIITDEIRAPYFDELISRRNSQDVSTGLFLVEDIYAEYEGEDDADIVRNFIIDAYQTYSTTDTPLEHVLLGGDDEIVPKRGCFGQVGNTIDNGIPCDLYFSCLDGDWNANGNNIYGEWSDEVDMLPEVSVGRIPAESEGEFSNFFYKTFHYEDNYALSDDIAYMLGENLNWDPLTWGGDYKDEVSPLLDEDIHIFTLYDRDGTFSSMAVKDAINYGVSVINHMGHSNENMVFGQNIGMTNSYTNSEYGFAYSQGCYPAAFDEATSGAGESIAENLVIKENGLFAFVGNTRYGWYSPGSTNGASQPYDIAYFDAIYQHDIREMGDALQYSREVLVNQALESGVMRWVYFELVLFGDPSVQVKDAAGGFPLIQPVAVLVDDSQGDGDTIVNPGETIEIYITLENLEGWADAEDVFAMINFLDENILVTQDSVFYGSIPSGSIGSSSSFVIEIPEDIDYGNYDYQLEVFAGVDGDVLFDKTYNMEIEISLFQLYWPWFGASSFISNPMITDFNSDGEREILVPDSWADIHSLNLFAEEMPGFPWISSENIWRSTALADLDGDELLDIVIASRNGKIYAYGNDGSILFSYEDCLEQLLTPVVVDLDGDMDPEIVSFGVDKKLISLDSSGIIRPGFPVELSFIGSSEMAVADLDGNGTAEIVIGTNDGNLFAITEDGDYLNGFPVNLGAPVFAAPVIDPEGRIIIGTGDSMLHIIGSGGTVEQSVQLTSRIAGSAILADFDNDQNLEIAAATVFGDLYLLEFDGSILPGWPVELEAQFQHPPLAADLDNDQFVDLITLSTMNCLNVFSHDGSEFDFSPVPTNLSGNTPASIDDIDADGDYEIVSCKTDGVIILDCKLPAGADLPWRTYRGNYGRTGYYGDNILLENEEILIPPLATELYQNYPNPFNPDTVIGYQLSQETGVSLKVYNVRGQLVRTLVSEVKPAGRYSVTWDGKDENRRSVSSGIYLYRFKAGSRSSIRKMILLK